MNQIQLPWAPLAVCGTPGFAEEANPLWLLMSTHSRLNYYNLLGRGFIFKCVCVCVCVCETQLCELVSVVDILINILISVTKYLWRRDFMKDWFVSAHSLEVQAITTGVGESSTQL